MLKGKISTFGGPEDTGMNPVKEGLSFYWTHEQCDERPDLFLTKEQAFLGMDKEQIDKFGVTLDNINTCKRLNPEALFFAYRFPLDPRPPRTVLINTQWLFRNPANGRAAVAWLADWGPHEEKTGRTFDLSDGLANALQAATDEVVEGVPLSELQSLFVA